MLGVVVSRMWLGIGWTLVWREVCKDIVTVKSMLLWVVLHLRSRICPTVVYTENLEKVE